MLEASCVHMALGAWINILQRQTLSLEYLTITTENDSSTSRDDYLPRNTKTGPNLTNKIVDQMQFTLSLKLDIRHYNNKWKLYRESIECNNMQMWTTQFDLEA